MWCKVIMNKLMVIGTVALDTIRIEDVLQEKLLGGSATYFSCAAQFFTKVFLISTVGKDFPVQYRNRLASFACLNGLSTIDDADTFAWEGEYKKEDMNIAVTLHTHLNVLTQFCTNILFKLQNTEFVFVANIDPDIQLKMVNNLQSHQFLALDTMNLWIEIKKAKVEKICEKIDLLIINEQEALQLSQTCRLLDAAKKILELGPKYLIIKRGSMGAVFFDCDSQFIVPPFCFGKVVDPTGAGDSFAGGVMGYLSTVKTITKRDIITSLFWGTTVASFAIEDFSVNGLLSRSKEEITDRFSQFTSMTCIEKFVMLK